MKHGHMGNDTHHGDCYEKYKKNNVRSQDHLLRCYQLPESAGQQGHTKTSHFTGFISTLAFICMISDRAAVDHLINTKALGRVIFLKRQKAITDIGAPAPNAAAWKMHKPLLGSGPRYWFVYNL